MRKKVVLFLLLVLNANLAWAEVFTQNTANICDFTNNTQYLEAVFELSQYTCGSGYYLPANHIGCEPCPTSYTCAGGTFTFDKNVSQGLTYSGTPINTDINGFCATNAPTYLLADFTPNEHTCLSGYYLPANVDACTQCPSGSACVGGTYSFNETTDQGIQSCVNGFSPSGSAVCYPHILHVGDDVIYVRSTKLTTPSLNIDMNQDGIADFFINMTTTRTRMNKDSTHYFHIDYGDIHYYLCDDTTYPAGE